MSNSFQQLEAPTRYHNSNGVAFGYVVRVVGFTRTSYLNDINEIQVGLLLLSSFCVTTALFNTIGAAHVAANRYYGTYGQEYDFACINGDWHPRGISKNATNYLGTVESELMEFE